MEEARPSRTALRVALRRAAHQLYDAQPLVLDDPIAVPILGKTYADELRKTPTRPDRLFSVALRAFLVARSRYAEDMLSGHSLDHRITSREQPRVSSGCMPGRQWSVREPPRER